MFLIRILVAFFFGLQLLIGIASATCSNGSAAWKLSTGGTWNNSSSWDAAMPTIPNSKDAVASFLDNLTADGMVTLDGDKIVGSLYFNNLAANYTIAGPGSITLQASSGSPLINVLAGAHTISAQINLTTNTDISVAADNMLMISGNVTGIGTGLNKIGDGMLILGGNNSYDGITTVSAGTLIAASSSALGSTSSGIIIQGNATLDLNSQNIGVEAITVYGSGVSGTGCIVNNGSSDQTYALQTVVLGSDACFGGIKRWDIHAPSNGNTRLDLANHTLTKIGNNQITLINTAVTDGNIVVNSGILGLQAGTKVLNNSSGTTITVNPGGTLDVGASGSTSFSITRPIVMNGGNLTNNSGGTTYLGSNITANASTTNSISTLNRLYIQGNISGSGSITKSAGGLPLYLTGNNSGFMGIWNQNYWMTYFSASNSGSPTATFVIHSTAPDNAAAILCTTTSGLSIQLGSLSGDSGYLLNRDQTSTNGNSSFVIGANNATTVFGGIIADNLAGVYGSGNPNTGTTSIQKVGTGMQILSGANIYTGSTTITNGKLFFNNSSALNYSPSAGNVTVNGGATLGGNGSISRTVVVKSGGSIEAGGSDGSGTLDLYNLTLGSQSTDVATINVANIDTTIPLRAVINVDSNVVANATTTINIGGLLPSVGQHKMVSFGALNLAGKTFNNSFVLGTLPGRMNASLVYNTGSNEIDLNVQSTDYPVWTGASGADWNKTASNWDLASNSSATNYIDGDNVVFDDTATKNYDINLPDTIQPTYTTANNSSHNYTFNGSGSIAGSGGLLKTGTGTLTINTVNSFSGDVAINSGTVVVGTITNIGSNSALGQGMIISFDGGSLNYTGGTTATNRSVILNAGGGTINVSSADSTLTLSNGSGVGGLTKEGLGRLRLTLDSNYGDITKVNCGTLELSGGLYSHGTIASSIFVNNGATLLFSQNNVLGKYLADPADTITINQGGLVENGGNSTISYFNTLEDLTLSGGELRVNGGLNTSFQAYQLKGTVSVIGTAPSQISLGSALYNNLTQIQLGNNTGNGKTTFNVADVTGDANCDLVIAPALADGCDSLGNVVASGMIKDGVGTLLLTGRNIYSGGMTINNGTIQIGNGGISGTVGIGGTITLSPGTSLAFKKSNMTVVDSTLNGCGTITQNGAGSVVFTKDNSAFTGTLNLNGPVTIANDNALGSVTLLQLTNGTLQFGAIGLNMGSLSGWNTTGIPAIMTPTTNFYKYLSGNQIGLNQTVVYQGQIHLTPGQWSFAKQYNMSAYLSINGQIVLNNTDNVPAAGSVSINRDGWYPIDLRVANTTSSVDPTLSWPFGIGVRRGSPPSSLKPTDFEAFGEGAAGISLQYESDLTFCVGNSLVLSGQNTIDTSGLGAGTVTLNGDISGTGGLTKTGSSDLLLTGQLSYSGDTNVEEGTLEVQELTNSANVYIGSGRVTLIVSAIYCDTLTMGAGSTLVIRAIPGGFNGDYDNLRSVPEPNTMVSLTVAVFGLISTWYLGNWKEKTKC
ncbi:MAG: autotransporter-associated beta strand repeat-containing protein [Thermoguttaceae bacterium]|jgi:autotransporter-associated beta strand protein